MASNRSKRDVRIRRYVESIMTDEDESAYEAIQFVIESELEARRADLMGEQMQEYDDFDESWTDPL